MKSKKITALVAGTTIAGSIFMYSPIIAHATTVKHVATHTASSTTSNVTTAKDNTSNANNTKYTLANSGLQLQAVNLKTGKVIPTTPKEKSAAAQSFAVTFSGYSHATRYDKYHLQQLKNQSYFHSKLQENLYNYLLNPNNRWKIEKKAIELHGGDRSNNCAYWVSTALNWIGADIPYTSYCGTLRNELANRGWVKMHNFDLLRAGDVCFAGNAHTYIFMGWANKGDNIAWIADSQYGWFGNNVHVRSTWTDGDISGTTDFWGAPGANVHNSNVDTSADAHPGYNSYNVGVVNTYSNVRSGPSTSYSIIGNYSSGSYVQIIGESGSWWKINYNGGTGYIYKSLVTGNGPVHSNTVHITDPQPVKPVKPQPVKPVKPTVYTSPQYDKIGTGTVKQYTWAMPSSNWSGGCVTTFNVGQSVIITGYTDGSNGSWYRVNYQKGSVWIPADRINPSFKGEQYKTIVTGVANYLYGNTVKVYNSASYTSTALGGIANGVPVNITGSKDGWYRINYQQTSGWVPANSLDNPDNYPPNSLKAVGIVNSTVNAKNIPNSYGYFNYKVQSGTRVNIVGEWQDWYKINNNGKTEWIPKSDVNIPVNHKVIGEGLVEFPSYGGSCITNGPSWDSGIKTILNDNTKVKIISEKNGWFQIELPDYSTAWIPRTRVVTSLNDNMMLGTGIANMYTYVQSGPAWSSTTKIGSLSNNTRVNIKSEKNGWYEIYYGNNGATAWVEGNRLNTSLNKNMKTISTGVIDFTGGNFTYLSYSPSWNGDYAGSINNGTTVQIVGESGNWYRINKGSSTAWVLKDRVNVGPVKVLGTGKVSFPSLGYTSVESVPSWGNYAYTLTDGTNVNIIGSQGDWYKISFNNGETGWIVKDRVATTLNEFTIGTGVISTSSNYINLMSQPTWSSKLVGSINTGSPVNIYGQKDGWTEIYYNGSYGWVPSNQITEKLDSNTSMTFGNINWRQGLTWLMTGPSWGTNHAGNLYNGTKVQIVDEQDGWYKITCPQLTAWVQKDRIDLLK